LEGTALVAAGSAIVAILLFAPEAIKELRVADARMVVVQTLIQGWVGGVISVVALIGALRTLSVQTAALLPILTPAVALFISTIVLGETPELSEIIGIAIIGFGFLASNNILSWRNGDVLTALAKRSG
ncbi:MAG: EamA family transporter, partial [Pseudomonadota bacterium]